MNESYYVDIQKEEFTFSAAHFITFNGNVCERLHGHNYGVRCRIHSPLDENHYVYDFILIRDTLREICGQLDHYMLLPDSHPTIKVSTVDDEVHVKFEDRRWIFPKGDCQILPVPNTTAELLAKFIGNRLLAELSKKQVLLPEQIEIGVDENNGQWGVWCSGSPSS